MMDFLFNLQIIIIAACAALSCSIPGVLLIVRGMALMSDAISHSVLLGIVVAFLIFKDLGSPFIFVGAIGASIATVFCTEKIIESNMLKKDAAVGLVFPLFFSIAVFLISQYARSVHLDTDMILVGEIAFAPLNKLIIGDWNLGAKAIWILLITIIVNCFIIFLFFRPFKVTIFDPHAAKMLGYNKKILHYLLMFLMSCTTVVVFDIVGAIICVALTIVPGATAFLYVKKLEDMFFLTAIISIITGILGAIAGIYFDVSIAGAISLVAGILFLISVLFEKYRIFLFCFLGILNFYSIQSSSEIEHRQNFALTPFEVKSKIFFYAVNKHDDKIQTLNSLFFVCKDWNDIIFNKRDKDQYVYKIHDLVHEYLCQRIENYKSNYHEKNRRYPDRNEMYNNHKNILFSPFACWNKEKKHRNLFRDVLFDYLIGYSGYMRDNINISVGEFTALVKKAPTITNDNDRSTILCVIKTTIENYFWKQQLAALMNLSDDTALLKNMYGFLEKNLGIVFATTFQQQLLNNIFRSCWQSDENLINQETIKTLEYYFKKMYRKIKGSSLLKSLQDESLRCSYGIFINKLIYVYFTHANTIEKMMVRQHENNEYLIKQLDETDIFTQIWHTIEVNNLLQKLLKHQKERINGNVIKFMRSIIYYRDYLKKMISNTSVEFFLRFEDPVALFNQLYSLDDGYAKQFFAAWFKKTIEKYYKNDTIDIMLLRSMFLCSSVFPCPLFSTDENGKTAYDHLKNLHEDFAKKDIYKRYALCGNIALGALRQYFSTMTKKDFESSKEDLKKIISAIVNIVEYRVDHLCQNSSSMYPIQDLLCEYDQDFGNEIFSLFLRQKYEREFSKEELEMNPLRYRYDMAQFGPSCRIDIGLNFFDVNLLHQIIMNLCEQKKKKEAKNILKTWQKDQPQRINEFLKLLLGDPDKIKMGITYKAAALSEQAKQREMALYKDVEQKKFDIYFYFLTKSWLFLMLSFSFYRFIFIKTQLDV